MAKSVFERHAKLTAFIVIVFLILIVDLLSTALIRFHFQRVGLNCLVSTVAYHHGFRENRSEVLGWGNKKYNFYTNSLGFKDKSCRAVPLTTDKHRILFMGDSFTEGSGFTYTDTFVGVIDNALSGEGIEVLNAAVASYSPIIYWRKTKFLLEAVGLRFDELIVFLDLSDVFDEAQCYSLQNGDSVVRLNKYPLSDEADRRGPFTKKALTDLKVFINENMTLTNAVLVPVYRALFNKSHSSKNKLGRWTIDPVAYNQYGKKGLEDMRMYMDKLFELLQQHGIKLTVAVYPWPDQVIHSDLHSIQVSFWQDWCRKHGVALLDYFPYFVTGNTPKERNEVVGRYFIDRDVHWNKAGHQFVAGIFLKWYKPASTRAH